MNPRTILFMHQSFPGQFGSLAASLAAEGHKVYALALNPQGGVPGVAIARYAPLREQPEGMASLLQDIDAKLIRAESAYKAMKGMKKQGINPDVIYAHPGWGEALFLKDVWPDARVVMYAEWFYNLTGQEVNFDPALPPLSEELQLRLHLKNTPFLHALSMADAAIAPTEWQKSRFPAWAQEKIHVVHDGINLAELASVRPRGLGIPSQDLKLVKGMPIITYASRHLEPVRGFHYFMRSLPAILKANPEAHVIVMGRDAGTGNLGYGADNPNKESWRKSMETELGNKVDWKRVHFLGVLERKLYLALLKLSACHVYLTTPFILSWSFLEAAALGVPIVTSDTAPVREMSFLSGLKYANFNDPEGIAQAVLHTLRQPSQDYTAENIAKLKDMDHCVALPKIREILLSGSPSSDVGGKIESVVFMDD